MELTLSQSYLPGQIECLYKQVVDAYGQVDVLINNAGIAISSDLHKADEDWLTDWETTFAVNTAAVGILCKKAIADMRINGGGRIINIAS